MAREIRILATGVRVDVHPDPEEALIEAAGAFGGYPSPEQRADLAHWRAGELAFVRLTSFAEFDDGSGVQRWEGTPQGPYAVSVAEPATSTLLDLVDSVDEPLLADFGISGMSVSRFAFHAAPRRIDIDPALVSRLTLD
jgi:hypothetical protein